jgi:hypothetical protein
MIVLAIGLLWWANSDSSLVNPNPPSPDDQEEVEPIPVPVTEPTEADHWNALALCVDRSSFGVLQQHTDHLLSIVDLLKSSGGIKDDSRIAAWRAKRIDITDSNRAEISKTLRGK